MGKMNLILLGIALFVCGISCEEFTFPNYTIDGQDEEAVPLNEVGLHTFQVVKYSFKNRKNEEDEAISFEWIESDTREFAVGDPKEYVLLAITEKADKTLKYDVYYYNGEKKNADAFNNDLEEQGVPKDDQVDQFHPLDDSADDAIETFNIQYTLHEFHNFEQLEVKIKKNACTFLVKGDGNCHAHEVPSHVYYLNQQDCAVVVDGPRRAIYEGSIASAIEKSAAKKFLDEYNVKHPGVNMNLDADLIGNARFMKYIDAHPLDFIEPQGTDDENYAQLVRGNTKVFKVSLIDGIADLGKDAKAVAKQKLEEDRKAAEEGQAKLPVESKPTESAKMTEEEKLKKERAHLKQEDEIADKLTIDWEDISPKLSEHFDIKNADFFYIFYHKRFVYVMLPSTMTRENKIGAAKLANDFLLTAGVASLTPAHIFVEGCEPYPFTQQLIYHEIQNIINSATK